MTTADPSNVLFKIAHPDLYERNPFNLLNLPINATARDIRRRKEDIEAAFDAGTEAEEFRFVLPVDANRRPPTRKTVNEAFEALNEPELHIAYALFWFWPDDNCPKTTAKLICDDVEDSIIDRWEFESDKSVVCRHNLAVYHHVMALTIEGRLRNCVASDTDKITIIGHWASAIELWNSVVSDADFWHSVSEMVSALNDPRLDYRFARSLRDQFAFAFDQINVELAIEFAKTGRESDAKRQVKYMKLSQPDADDVEGTFDDAFAGLLRQTEAICKAAQDETEKNHKDGLRQANLILEQTDEPLRVSRVVLEKGTAIRNAIGTTIFSAVRNCLIAYGNETEEWDECLSLAYQMSAFAETVEQWNLLSEDVNTLEDLSRKDNLRHSCWICKTRIPKHMHDSSVISVPLHGRFEASKDYRSVNYKAIDIDVPVCANCLSERSPHSFEKFPECIAYPTVIDAVKDGWNIGKEVSPETVEEVLSSARSKNQEDKKAGNSYGLTSDQQLFAQIRLRTND